MIKYTKDLITPITLSDLRKIDIDASIASYIKEINSELIIAHLEGKKNASIPVYIVPEWPAVSLSILQAKYPDFNLRIKWVNATMYLVIEWE